MKMNLFESDFMRRARYLTEDKRALLLDTMARMNKKAWEAHSKYNHPASWQEKKEAESVFAFEIQKGIITAYLLLDSPIERTALQVEKRLREIEKIYKQKNTSNLYYSAQFKYERKESELGIELEDAFNLAEYRLTLSNDTVPSHKKEEYQEQMFNYMQASDTDRERFIKEVTHPYSTHKPHCLVKMGRGITD